jgi:hypothetical protein
MARSALTPSTKTRLPQDGVSSIVCAAAVAARHLTDPAAEGSLARVCLPRRETAECFPEVSRMGGVEAREWTRSPSRVFHVFRELRYHQREWSPAPDPHRNHRNHRKCECFKSVRGEPRVPT